MQVEFYLKIKEAFSASRIECYRGGNFCDAEVLAGYLLNSALSEALYPLLQNLEVCFRNEIDRVVSIKFGVNWILERPAFLNEKEILKINQAKFSLEKTRSVISHDSLVSELNFGFWTSLLDVRYERPLWQGLIGKSFTEMPRRERTRKNLSARFNKIRKLRNRVFHHGRIIHWIDLEKQHYEIIEAIGWISKEVQDLVTVLDNFTVTYDAGLNPWLRKISDNWSRKLR